MKRDIGVNYTNFVAERKEIERRLGPCPFCGNADIEFSLIHPQYNGHPDMAYWCYWEILCPDCGANMENGVGADYENADVRKRAWEAAKEELIGAWNRRSAK